jgi:hypothetical protein
MSGTNHLRDLKAGDVIVVGTGKRATTVTVDSVGRNYLYAGTGIYRRDNGRQKTGNGIARTVLGWRTEMQAAAARSVLSAVYIDVGYNVSADKGLCNEDMHLDNTPVSISTEVNPVITRPKRAFLQDAPFPVFVACHAPIV